MVNDDTRSAAELLAGALRDNNLATMIGTRTFGKGVLQDWYEAGNNIQVKITTARYFLPNGESIHNKGLQPDIVVTQGRHEDSQLSKALNVLSDRIAHASGDSQRNMSALNQTSPPLM